jgi:hypothetical protein
VTCPTCGAEWFHPETIEFSAVEFRCAKSGARFVVILSRRSPLHKFAIKEIAKPAPAGTVPSIEPSPILPQIPARRADSPPVGLFPPKVGGWLARISGRNGKNDQAMQSDLIPAPKQEPANSTPTVTAHVASEYNWSGFSCPYCAASSFVSCSGGHLVCDGATEFRNGRRFHHCFCGDAGLIEGQIKTFEGHHHVVQAENGTAKPASPRSTEVGGDPTKKAISSQKDRIPSKIR